ncbi:unnamed protein product [Lactuca saligna]|uniref:Uncharacterized protein n=1 Tax=Lactuca saligna TaxID=75948 RepID=A0AA36EJH4_LACSI|nr:unnamed protein product [Lactuca saligna]
MKHEEGDFKEGVWRKFIVNQSTQSKEGEAVLSKFADVGCNVAARASADVASPDATDVAVVAAHSHADLAVNKEGEGISDGHQENRTGRLSESDKVASVSNS